MNSPKRMMVEAVRENVRRTHDLLTDKKCSRASCYTSWGKQRDLANEESVTGIEFTQQDEKDRDQALAGYDRAIADLDAELKRWEEALSHALDALEGRV
jgi:hypothetical protein